MQEPLLMNINNTVYLRDNSLIIIDRRRFPHAVEEVVCCDYEKAARCIEDMAVQGAGDIAVAAGYGLYLAAIEVEHNPRYSIEEARNFILAAAQRLINTRPTGGYLAALLSKMTSQIDWENTGWSSQFLRFINASIAKQQKCSELTGKWACTVLDDGDTILTHCFPGAALLHMLDLANKQGKKVEVICTETRPYLQGARLTAWSVSEMGIPVTLITDNMAAHCMNQGMVSKVFTAADRVAMDGTIANKIGTFQLALAAQYHHIPFYILGYGAPDKRCQNGRDILIEHRDSREVLTFNGKVISGDKVKGFYPAFDLTPPELLAGIITDRGILPSAKVDMYWLLPAENNSSARKEH